MFTSIKVIETESTDVQNDTRVIKMPSSSKLRLN